MIAHITDSNFESEVLASKGLVLVDFWAPWCGPCKMLAPVLESLDKEIGDKVAIKNLNTDENRIYPERYDIMGIPTMMIFKDGQLADSIVGFTNKEGILAKLQALL